MRHTRFFPSALKTSILKPINGRHILFVAGLVLLASAGFAALLYGRTEAFVIPSLGTAQNFAVLAGSTATNVPAVGTIVTGDLGVWPGLAITGFPPGIVNGTIHAGNAVAMQAQADVTTAYNSLAGLPCLPANNLTGQDLGGLTLAPGVYCFNTSAQLTGTLTLDAQGDPEASFIFQIGSTLVTASNSNVQVINGAQGCGAFWQVGSSATLGTGTSFIGSILALASVTLNTNATLSGRALARTGAVTMDNNIVTRTTCAPTVAKSFIPPTINVGGISQLTITLSNPNTIAANLTAPFTDNLPAGVLIAVPPNAASTCGGVVTATPGGSAVTLTGGAIPAGNGILPGTCTITVNVTSLLPGDYLNTIPIGALQTSNGNNTAPASATLTVICPPINTIITAPVAVCALSTGNVASVPDAGANATYNWTITNGMIISGQGTASINWTAGSTSPVMLSVTITALPGCSANGALQIPINSNPTAAAGPPQELCQTVPGPTVFSLNGSVTNGTPQWSVIGSTGTAVGSIVTPNSASTNVNVTGNGTVTLRLTATSNATPSCGTATSDIVLTVNANPTAAAGVDQTLCQTLPGPTVFNVTGTATNGIPTWNVLSTTGTASATIVNPNSATTAVNVTGFGTVTLRLTVTSANCGAAMDDVVLTVLPAPIANAGIDQAACQTIPGPTVFTVAGIAANGIPATPAWTVVGATGTAVPVILTPNNATTGVNITGIGTVTLRFTVNSNSTPNCGTAFDDVVLTVTTNAIALAGPDQALCQTVPGPTVFTVNGTGGAPNWSVIATTGTAVATIVSPNTAMTAVNVTGLGTVTLRLNTTSAGCGSTTDDVVLTVNPNPAAAAGPDQMLCQTLPGPTVFTVTGTVANGTPQWSVVGSTGTAMAIIVTPNSATTNVNVAGNGTVTLRLSATSSATPSCGTAVDDIVLTVNSSPTAAAGVDQSLCQLVPGPTVFTVMGTVVNSTPQWSVVGSTGTAVATIVSPNSATTNVNVTGNGTVTLRLTATSNATPSCGTAFDDVVLTVNANPVAAAGVDQTLCQTVPGPTVFTVTGTANNGTPAWSVFATTGTASAIIVSPNSATTNVNVTGNGTVTLRLTVTSNLTPNCGAVSDDVVLTVLPAPIANAGIDQAICQTNPGPTVFTVSGVATNGIPSIPAWTVFSTTGTAVPTILTPNNTTTVVNITGIGTVTLRFTVNSTSVPNCGTGFDDVVLTVTAGAVALAGPDQSLCQTLPGPTVFTVNGAGGPPTWTVFATTGTAMATIVSPNSPTTNVNVTGLGTVTLRLTTTSPTCGTAMDDVVLTVNASPAAAAGPDQSLCQVVPGPTAFTVTGTFTNGLPATPAWTVVSSTGTAIATILTPNAAVTGVNIMGTGTVTLRFTVNSNAIPACGPAMDDIVLTVNANPLSAAGVDQALCQTNPAPTVFTVTGTVSGGTPQWSVLATTGTAVAIIVTPNSATTNVSVIGIGTVTLRLTVTSNTTPACGTAMDDVVLTVNENPASAAGPGQMLCQTIPGPTVFTVTGTVSGGTPQWSVLSTTGTASAIIVSPNNSTTNVNVTGTGTVTLRLSVTSNATPNCGTATSEVVLTVNPSPVATITAALIVCALSPGNTASVPDAGPGATYNWTITGGAITSGQGTRIITYTAGNTGILTLSVTVTTAAGCIASSSITVTVDSTCGVDVCVEKTGSALVAYETGRFTYTLSIINLGPGPATGVTVTDTLSSGLTLVSATPSQGTCSGTSTITCNLGNLAAQATATVRLVVMLPMKSAGTIICNTATVTSDQTEIGPANNTSTLCVPVEKVPPGPGPNLPPTSQISDQKSGSVLIFPYYTSDASNSNIANTRICLTNVENQWSACVHLFFVDGATCSVADANICLSPNQTSCFQMSDLDPGSSGYVVAVLVDCMTGCPLNINTLIGDEYVKLASGHAANLAAEAIAGLPGARAVCDNNSSTAELKFDGVMYNQLPRVLALDSLGSRSDGNDTLLVVNRIGGNLGIGASTLGTLFGILYDDAERGISFQISGGCQIRSSLSNNFPRTAPRFENFITAGRTGWLKLYSQSDFGILGAAINFNPNTGANAGAFNQGHNLHKLTLTSGASLTIPVFPPSC